MPLAPAAPFMLADSLNTYTRLLSNARQLAKAGELYAGVKTEPPKHDLVNGRRYNAGHSRGRILVTTTLPSGATFSFWKKAPRRKASKQQGGMY